MSRSKDAENSSLTVSKDKAKFARKRDVTLTSSPLISSKDAKRTVSDSPSSAKNTPRTRLSTASKREVPGRSPSPPQPKIRSNSSLRRKVEGSPAPSKGRINPSRNTPKARLTH
ncbi:hypothetical protein SK128_001061, partial [Halocaridina rubra]